MKRLATWLAGCALVAGATGVSRAEVVVFAEDRPARVITVPAQPTAGERAAAAELARVLGVMSGAVWRVATEDEARAAVLAVGRTRRAAGRGEPLRLARDPLQPGPGEVGPDAFRVRAADDGVTLEGATDEALFDAACWLLERHGGVRWLAPGALGEVVPRRDRWVLPDLDDVRAPAFLSREIYRTDEGWARHNGLRRRLDYSHALHRVFPPALFAVRPEWFPLVRGERARPTGPDDYHWQPDLTHDDVVAFAAGAAQRAWEADPRRVSFSLGINDSVRFDQGAATHAAVAPLRYFRGMPDYSPLVFGFLNRVAARTAPERPDRYLGGLAYFWCENVPPFPVAPQVLPYVATDRSQYFDAALRAGDLDLLERWGRSGVRAFGLWEYAYGDGFLIPRQPTAALAEALRHGWRHGARGYIADATPQWGFDAFKAWALAQLLRDPTRTLEKLADDFFPAAYGAAAAPMRRFVARCEAVWMGQGGAPYWLKYYRQEDQARLFPEAVRAELRQLLRDAEAAAAGNSAWAARVTLTVRAWAVTEAAARLDAIRRDLAARDAGADDTTLAAALGDWLEARRALKAALDDAARGEVPAMEAGAADWFGRHDPVPRLLVPLAQRDPAAAAALLAAVARRGEAVPGEWSAVVTAARDGRLARAEERVANGDFAAVASRGQEPAWLFPRSGELPAGWEVRAVPSAHGRVALLPPVGGRRALRIEGAWDTQVYQWRPAVAGALYVAAAEAKGRASAGSDSGLFLAFLDARGRVTGPALMQTLPKDGETVRGLRLVGAAPADAVWVGVGVGASRQTGDDWLEATGVQLREVRTTQP